ncbi:MAG: hypothetical protein WAV76_09855 [Bacteroidota bacterium]
MAAQANLHDRLLAEVRKRLRRTHPADLRNRLPLLVAAGRREEALAIVESVTAAQRARQKTMDLACAVKLVAISTNPIPVNPVPAPAFA